ncbi:membrane protein [Streptomyces ruber]|uniref:Membrane protein n=2 Tax=Streptomyces TaxID=1883 RepID=A0A918EUR6_9ACTN|nr:CAP domain-containing protein [Streptomyces ruber]GGQ71040.1 membrane protein [Streptomyces ruber]
MGRHRRSAAGRAATGRATGAPHTHDAPTEHYGPENLYGFAAVLEAEADAPPGRRSHRKQKRTVTPVRTGLLGVSAAVALGTVAVTTGVLPGGGSTTVTGGGSTDNTVQPANSPSSLETQQGGSRDAAADREDGSASSRDNQREASPSASPSSPAETTPSTEPSEEPSSKAPAETKEPERTEATEKPSEKATEKPAEPERTAPADTSSEAQAAAQVLALVNKERAAAGCRPVAANSALSQLASAFSEDMAARGFFDHTDPDGASPWDRAAVLGIADLGGENIARGQATPEAVMEAWMNSPGHRANILNCDFTTLGVGVHLGEGGPWWTQDFGY